MDVVATGSNGYAVLTNDGTGALSIDFPPNALSVGGGRPRLADIDGDDDLDLLETVTDFTQPNRVVPALRRNDGTGAFGAIELVRPMPLGVVAGFGAFDADGDGDVDLVASGGFDAERLLAVFPNDGTGAFGPAATYPLGYSSQEATSGSLEAGDLDADGDVDLVISDLRRTQPPGEPSVTRTIALVALNDGDGGFAATGGPIDVARPGLLAPLDPALADLDEDGDLDLAVGGSGSITTLLAVGAGGFGAPRTSLVPDTHALEFVAPTDIDEDGHVDLVAFDDLFSSKAGVVVYGDGTGGVADSHVVDSGTEIGDDGVIANDVEITDIDGDGDPDILFVAGNLGVVENDTNGRRPVH
jgi:hypothetical protein